MRVRQTGVKKCLRGLILASALGASSLPSGASVMRYLPEEELADKSALVVRARITGQSVHWTANREGIYTRIEAVVLDSLKGAAAPGRRLTIIQAGGEIDGVSLDWHGRPTFRPGEDLVLFLQAYEENDPGDTRLLVVGGKQGRMRVIAPPAGEAGAGRTGPPTLMVERELAGVLGAPGIEGDVPQGPAPRRDLIDYELLRRKVTASRAGGRP